MLYVTLIGAQRWRLTCLLLRTRSHANGGEWWRSFVNADVEKRRRFAAAGKRAWDELDDSAMQRRVMVVEVTPVVSQGSRPAVRDFEEQIPHAAGVQLTRS